VAGLLLPVLGASLLAVAAIDMVASRLARAPG